MDTTRTTPDTWQPAGETVLGIWAHPDDEAYLSAGLMARTVASGGRVVCIHATRGEDGTDDPQRWPPELLGPHRERELAAALAAVGVHEHDLLGYPDGGCDGVADRDAVERLTDAMYEVRPDLVVTFGSDGITGHTDHATVSRWATAAWQTVRHGRLLYATSTTSFLHRHREVHERLGLLPSDAPRIADRDVALRVRLSERELTAKRAALAAHASQTVALAAAMGEATYRRWYDVEAFRVPTADELRRAVTSVRTGAGA